MSRRRTLATYFFEAITAAQALAFNGAQDALVFTTASETGASERLIFNTNGTITVLSNVAGHQATFGASLAGATQILYPDGSQMLVGSTGNDVLTADAHNDGLFGGFGADTLVGGAGDDAIQGGPGADVLTGGGGRNLFIVAHGESPAVAGQMDTITDWQSTDALTFFRGPTDPASYMEGTAADLASATAFANTQIAGGTIEYVSMQVGANVIVFADSAGDHGVADDAVILAGRTLADIDASNIVTTAIFPAAQTTAPPPTSSPPPGTLAPSVLPPLPVFPTVPPSSPTSPLIVTPETFPSPLPPATSGVTVVLSADIDPTQLANALTTGFPTLTPTAISVVGPAGAISLNGFGFALDDDGNLTGGTVTGIDVNIPGGALGRITGLSMPVASILDAEDQGTGGLSTESLYAGDDSIFISSASGVIHGYAGNDTIESGVDPVALSGDAGDDYLIVGPSSQLIGGPGADTMTAPAGSDVFVFNPGDGNPAAAAGNSHLELLDRIEGWNSSDFLQFVGGAVPTSANFAEVTAGSFSAALTDAQANLAQGIEYTVAQVGNLYVLVVDLHTNNAVVLDDRTLANISMSNMGPDPAELSTSSPPASGGGQVLQATAGNETVQGGSGDDTISGGPASDYLRGNDGDDSIQGGVGFDDINGNKGNDTISGDLTVGNDWLVGGQNNDSITAHSGQNLLYGNLGNDTLQGGNGADILRGGQGDDVLFGGSGNQFLSGDRGNDTVTAGSGNDTIHSSQDAGIDRILGYNPGHDVVQLDPGTQFAVTQVGADTVITMTGSPGTNEVILVGVPMSSLTGNWIFGA